MTIEQIKEAIKSCFTDITELALILRITEAEVVKSILLKGVDNFTLKQELALSKLANRIEAKKELKRRAFVVPSHWVRIIAHQDLMTNGLPKPKPKLYAA